MIRDNNTSLQSSNVEDIVEIHNSKIIEEGVTKSNKNLDT